MFFLTRFLLVWVNKWTPKSGVHERSSKIFPKSRHATYIHIHIHNFEIWSTYEEESELHLVGTSSHSFIAIIFNVTTDTDRKRLTTQSTWSQRYTDLLQLFVLPRSSEKPNIPSRCLGTNKQTNILVEQQSSCFHFLLLKPLVLSLLCEFPYARLVQGNASFSTRVTRRNSHNWLRCLPSVRNWTQVFALVTHAAVVRSSPSVPYLMFISFIFICLRITQLGKRRPFLSIFHQSRSSGSVIECILPNWKLHKLQQW